MTMENTTNITRLYVSCSGYSFHFRQDSWHGINLLVIIILYLLTTILIAATNIVIIRTIKGNRRLNTSSCLLILTNCICDFGLSTLSSPTWSTVVILGYMNVTVNCHLFIISIFMLPFFAIMSFFIVTLISVDKYLGVLKPFFYQQHIDKWKKVYLQIIGCFSIFTITLIVITVILELTQVLVFGEIVLIISCLMLNITIYVVIYKEIKLLKTNYQKRVGSKYESTTSLKEQKKGALTSFLFVCSQYLCYSPHVINSVITAEELYSLDITYAVSLWSYQFVLFKSLFNPILSIISLKKLQAEVFGDRTKKGNSLWDIHIKM